MTTTMAKPSKLTENAEGLVEMAWDPITRIVGSLGIYTKIDFKQRGRQRVQVAPPRSSAAIRSS